MFSYGKLGLTIYLALTLSSLTVGITFKLWLEHDARALAAQLEAEVTAVAKKFEYQALVAQRKNSARQTEQNKARAKLNAANAQRQRTCTFWRDQYAKTRKSYDKTIMGTACK